MNTTKLLTRNNLLKIKEKLKFLYQGQDLLEKKKFILTVEKDRYENKKIELEKTMEGLYNKSNNKIKEAIIDVGIDELINIANELEIDDSINIKYKTIMGVEIPSVIYNDIKNELNYDLYRTTSSIDEMKIEFIKIRKCLIELVEIDSIILKLESSIKKTERRFNALKNIVVIKNEKLKREIENVLEEREREEFIRQKRIKNKKASYYI